MTPEEDQISIEKQLVDEFLRKFYKKVGYYPIVLVNEYSNINRSKAIALKDLEAYFTPYVPKIFGKKLPLASKNRSRPMVELRFIFSQIARSMNYSLKDIGRYLGDRDHSTIIYGLDTFKNLYETESTFRKLYHQIVNDIKKKYESSVVDNIDQTQNKPQSDLFFRLLQGEDSTF